MSLTAMSIAHLVHSIAVDNKLTFTDEFGFPRNSPHPIAKMGGHGVQCICEISPHLAYFRIGEYMIIFPHADLELDINAFADKYVRPTFAEHQVSQSEQTETVQ